MNKIATWMTLAASAALLAACGGGGDGGNNGASATPAANGGGSSPAANPAPAAFSCPDTYKKITLSNNSSVPNANMSITTDDNIAKLTVKTPASGLSSVTICLGKPNPVPAGVTADYVYELKTDGAYSSLLNPQLSLTFSTSPTTLAAAPNIEIAQSSSNGVTYTAAPNSTGTVNGTNVSVTASATAAGVYVVRLPH